jgi:hypothetical protein
MNKMIRVRMNKMIRVIVRMNKMIRMRIRMNKSKNE